MNKTEKLAFLKKLAGNPRITELWYHPDLVNRRHEDSIWYDDEVLSFVVDNRFVYSCRAVGDVRITHIPTDDDVVSKGNHADDVVEFLEGHGLTTDKKVSNAEAKGELYFGNNNWFEDWIYDRENQEYIDMSDADISDGPFTIDLDYIDEWIKYYKQGQKEG